MPANIAVNSSGWMVTSKNCSKLRRIFSVARQAIVIVCWTVSARLTWRVGGRCVVGVDGGHRTVSGRGISGRRLSGSWVSWPVSARNTSSSEGFATRDGLDGDAVLAQREQHVDGPVAAGQGDGQAAGLGGGDGLLVEQPLRRAPAARSRSSRSASCTCSVEPPIDDLSSSGVPSATFRPRSMTCDPVGELVGLVEVLGGQQHGAALADQLADGLPHLPAGARVEAGGRLVEEDQRRPGDQARGQVEPAAHAAGEVLDRLVRRLLEVELLEQPVRRTTRLGAADALQAGEEDEVLGGGEQLVDRGVLAGDAEQLADDVRLAADVDAEDGRLARVDRAAGSRAS